MGEESMGGERDRGRGRGGVKVSEEVRMCGAVD
jgi:hypothetical protein